MPLEKPKPPEEMDEYQQGIDDIDLVDQKGIHEIQGNKIKAFEDEVADKLANAGPKQLGSWREKIENKIKELGYEQRALENLETQISASEDNQDVDQLVELKNYVTPMNINHFEKARRWNALLEKVLEQQKALSPENAESAGKKIKL